MFAIRQCGPVSARRTAVMLGVTLTGPNHRLGALAFQALEPRAVMSGNEKISMLILETTAFDAETLQRRFGRAMAKYSGIQIDTEMLSLGKLQTEIS